MIAFLLMWFGFGTAVAVLSYPFELAMWQRMYPTIADAREDTRSALLFSTLAFFFPPVCLLVNLLTGTYSYGHKWKAHDSDWARRRRSEREAETAKLEAAED